MTSISTLAATLGLALLASAGGPAFATEKTGTFADPSRVAAIGGSITEIVYALGEEKRLVARDSTSVYPPEAMALPDVGYMRALSPEGVLSVKPSAILALHGSGPAEAVDVLKRAKIDYIEVPDTYDHKGILDKIRIVGAAIGAPGKAEELSARVDGDLAAAEALTRDIKTRSRVLFILSFQDGKMLGSGAHTAADGIIRLAGGVNAVDGFSGYKQLSDEAVMAADPDIVLMMDRGGDHSATADQLFAHPALSTTPAGKARRLVRMDGAYLLGFGPRTADAVRELATWLYGTSVGQ